ncbi:MAG: glycerol-3-phosphate 1-O-acyltransferase PlsY [bacterium]|nr:glycerol-3-phosphate 1-O-acyltransferase PlsY [bacterium]
MMLSLSCILAFLLGSIPTGLLLGKLKGIDVRSVGSGNIGATNVKRALGKKAGAITLVLDTTKGILAVSLIPAAFNYLSDINQLPVNLHQQNLLTSLPGLFVVLGHCYSLFLKFNGGKGVATSLGVFTILAPIPTLFAAIVFLMVVKVKKYVALGSLVAAIATLIAVVMDIGDSYDNALKATVAAIVVIVILRHTENIKRLIRGNELAH